MKAIILAGGRGERLRPLTDTIPKPMIRVVGKPVLEHLVDLFRKNGIVEFVFTLCYKPHVVQDYFGDGRRFGVTIEYTVEDEARPLGTAGGVKAAQSLIGGTFIVCSGDILRELDIGDMLDFHKKNGALGTFAVYKRFGRHPKSMVHFGSDNRIIRFVERPVEEDISDNFVWSNGSFYIFEPAIFDFIPSGTSSDFGNDIFPALLAQKKRVFAYSTRDYFMDIGSLENLKEGQTTFKGS